jgi:preprotein translocase subunit SecA
MGEHHSDEEEVQLLIDELRTMLPADPALNVETFLPLSREEALDWLSDYAERAYAEKEEKMGAPNMRVLERLVMLGTIDRLWVEHLTAMDEMRQGIGLHAYGQRDPVVMYRREAHDMWEQLLENIRHGITRSIYHANLSPQAVPASPNVRAAASARTNADAADSAPTAPASANNGRKVGRNDPCPCGSGKKYKKCHGMAA